MGVGGGLVKTVDRIAVFNCDGKQRERGAAKMRGERPESEWGGAEGKNVCCCAVAAGLSC